MDVPLVLAFGDEVWPNPSGQMHEDTAREAASAICRLVRPTRSLPEVNTATCALSRAFSCSSEWRTLDSSAGYLFTGGRNPLSRHIGSAQWIKADALDFCLCTWTARWHLAVAFLFLYSTSLARGNRPGDLVSGSFFLGIGCGERRELAPLPGWRCGL